MKSYKIFSSMLLLLLFFSFSSQASTQRAGMLANVNTETEANYYYINEDGNTATNEWKYVWSCWYYFGEYGKSKQNTWFEINDKWYYFDSKSIMLHDTVTPDGYTVGSDGAWIESEPQITESVPTTEAVGPGIN